MNNRTLSLLVVLCAALADSDPLFAQAVHLHSVDIIDNQGFGERLIAGRFMAPVGWTAQGFAAWPGTSEGVPTEGYTETAIITTTNQTPLGLITQVSIPIVVNKFAPMGKLKEADKLLSAIANTVSVNPDWQRRVDQFQAGLQRIQQNINADDANTARNIASIQQGANDYAYNVIRGAQRNAQHGVGSSAHAFALSMNDTQEYHDPATDQTVLGSNQYNHVYSNGQGEYIYSDSPIYDPNATLRGNWQEMKPQR